jgi:hypothetical protein
MKQEGAFAEALQSAPTRKLQATLVRRVPLSPLIESGHVDYLFMSGRPYRFNTAGVRCIYFDQRDSVSVGGSQAEGVRGRERGDLPGLRAATGLLAHPRPHPEAVAALADMNWTSVYARTATYCSMPIQPHFSLNRKLPSANWTPNVQPVRQ